MSLSDESTAAALRSTGPVVRRCRDVLYWFDGGSAYVLACDSNAGIGQRQHDALKQPALETGYSAAKVALMEVLAAGARPFVLANALGGPRDDYGRQLLSGIQAAIDEVDAEIELTGSDETNIPTAQTAIGVTVVGRTSRTSLRLGTARAGDAIVVVGIPKDGLDVPYAEGDSDIANLRDLQTVADLSDVHELVPVGSRGIGYEARQLAAGARCRAHFGSDHGLDLAASAGSSTCFLAAVAPGRTADLAALVRPPVTVVAHLIDAPD